MIDQYIPQMALLIRLMADDRVAWWNKAIVVAALIYWISPVDLIMGIPGIDAIDDIAVLAIAYKLFMSNCPPEVIRDLKRRAK